MSEYKHPEVLVSTDWAAQNLNAPKTRFVEVDVDTTAYDQGHIPGAVGWNWQTQLQDGIRRDLIDKAALEKLLGASGISNDTAIILYGDNNNWFAAYAFWQLKLYGHKAYAANQLLLRSEEHTSNSSHRCSSYAGFRLKKYKQI